MSKFRYSKCKVTIPGRREAANLGHLWEANKIQSNMNTFGKQFRISIFGESHGQCVGVTIDGCPSGLPINHQQILQVI